MDKYRSKHDNSNEFLHVFMINLALRVLLYIFRNICRGQQFRWHYSDHYIQATYVIFTSGVFRCGTA